MKDEHKRFFGWIGALAAIAVILGVIVSLPLDLVWKLFGICFVAILVVIVYVHVFFVRKDELRRGTHGKKR